MPNEQISVKIGFDVNNLPLVQLQKQLNGLFSTLKTGMELDLGAKIGEGILELPNKIAEFIKQGVEYAETVRNMAMETRTTGSAFQVLSLLATDAGTDVARLTTATTAMATAAADAVNGVPKVSDAFKDLHINAQEFSALSVPMQLQALAKAAEQAGWSTQAMNDLTEILGKRNLPALLPVLHELAEKGWKEYADAAAKAGLIVSDQVIGAVAHLAEEQKKTAQAWKVSSAEMANAAIPVESAWTRVSRAIAKTISEGLRFQATHVIGPGFVASTGNADPVGVDSGTGAGAAQVSETARAAQAKAWNAQLAKDEAHTKEADRAYQAALKELNVVLERVDKEDKRERAEAEKIAKKEAEFDLQTKIQAAEQAGDNAKANALRLDQERLQHEGMTASVLDRRLAVMKQEQDTKLQLSQLAALEIPLQERAREVEQQRALISTNRSETQAKRDKKLAENAAEYRAVLQRIVDLEGARLKLTANPEEIARLKTEIDRLKAESARYGAKQDPDRRETPEERSAAAYAGVNDPSKHFQSAGSGATGAFMDIASKLQTVGDTMHAIVTGIAQTLSGSVSQNLIGLINHTTRWGQAWRNVGAAVEQSVIRTMVDAVVQQGISTAAQVAIHSGGEASKTAATAAGASARGGIAIGETAVHVAHAAIRFAAHLASEVGKTAVTVAQAGIRILVIVAESMAYVVQAAVGALSALASIPYVGPFLAVGAMAAILAAGTGLVRGATKGFRKGGYTGDGPEDGEAGTVHFGEGVLTARTMRIPGVMGVMHALNSGNLSAAAAGLHAAAFGSLTSRAGSLAAARAGASGGSLGIIVSDDRQTVARQMRGRQGSKATIDSVRGNMGQLFAFRR